MRCDSNGGAAIITVAPMIAVRCGAVWADWPRRPTTWQPQFFRRHLCNITCHCLSVLVVVACVLYDVSVVKPREQTTMIMTITMTIVTITTNKPTNHQQQTAKQQTINNKPSITNNNNKQQITIITANKKQQTINNKQQQQTTNNR